ncbi:MAG: YHS domain-containing protein [Candidatus Solibacter usitatus]|nr:YHS domain-containing protein [Candidatus Solibacter usitatus]
MKNLALCFLVLALAVLGAANGLAVKPELVCMMQDMVLTKPGIPIQHQGKTYYGCCQMCKDKIASDPERYTKATDPVSGKAVDKATAAIYGLEGSAYYFESKANLKTFAADPKKYLKK